jgi:hypothetical protein
VVDYTGVTGLTMKVLLAVVLATAVGACGSDDSDTTAAPERSTTTEPEATELEQAVDTVRGNFAGGMAADLETEVGRRLAAGLEFILHNVELQDEGHTLTIDGEGGYRATLGGGELASQDIAFQILDELGAPDAVWAKIENTRALDGMQTETWVQFTATWTYHPDNGLDVIIEEA